MGKYGRRGAKAAAVKHRGPEQGVEVKNIFAHKMVQLSCCIRAPEGIEVKIRAIAQIAKTSHIAYRRVEPYIKIFSARPGNLKTKIGCIAGDIPILQAGLKPFTQFVFDFGLQPTGACPAAKH